MPTASSDPSSKYPKIEAARAAVAQAREALAQARLEAEDYPAVLAVPSALVAEVRAACHFINVRTVASWGLAPKFAPYTGKAQVYMDGREVDLDEAEVLGGFGTDRDLYCYVVALPE